MINPDELGPDPAPGMDLAVKLEIGQLEIRSASGANAVMLLGEFSYRDPVTAARLTAMREKVWTFIGRHAGGLQWRILWFAHTKYIVGVSGLVRNSAGQVLLIKGRMWKPSRPWGLVTGYAESRERWEDTVVREAREETGFEVKVEPNPVRLVTGFKLRAEVAYLAEYLGGTYQPDPKEVLEARFFDIDELPEGLLGQHRDLIEHHRYWFTGEEVDRAHAPREAHGHTAAEAGDL